LKVRKAVIPAAGLGTRFLPITKTLPKELLPLVDRAAMQYVIEEIADAGIEHVVVVTSRGKEAIADYFDRHWDLERALEAKGDTTRLADVRRVSDLVEMSFVYQSEQLGLGHAVHCAASVVGDEPFAVVLPDVVVFGQPGATAQLVEVFDEYNASVITVQEVPGPSIQSYGVIVPEPVAEGVYRVRGTVEKPAPQDAPSNLAILGRYVFTPGIFDALSRVKPGALGEIQLTDAMGILLESEPMYASRFQGQMYDVGNPLGLLQASIELALQRDDIGPALMEYLEQLVE
jgi:UTP--glucose-1-phosphate uridylyltransferase